MIDKASERHRLRRCWAKTGNGEECCLNCRKHGKRVPRPDKHKNHRRR